MSLQPLKSSIFVASISGVLEGVDVRDAIHGNWPLVRRDAVVRMINGGVSHDECRIWGGNQASQKGKEGGNERASGTVQEDVGGCGGE